MACHDCRKGFHCCLGWIRCPIHAIGCNHAVIHCHIRLVLYNPPLPAAGAVCCAQWQNIMFNALPYPSPGMLFKFLAFHWLILLLYVQDPLWMGGFICYICLIHLNPVYNIYIYTYNYIFIYTYIYIYCPWSTWRPDVRPRSQVLPPREDTTQCRSQVWSLCIKFRESHLCRGPVACIEFVWK